MQTKDHVRVILRHYHECNVVLSFLHFRLGLMSAHLKKSRLEHEKVYARTKNYERDQPDMADFCWTKVVS